MGYRNRLAEASCSGLDRFLNIAHRGACGIAPENTFSAFEAAMAAEATAVEMDLRVTADGHVVVIHDATVNRTTDGRGKVARWRLTDLRSLDAGSWFDLKFAGERIPTLEEVFERVSQQIPLVLHVKVSGAGIEDRIVDLARAHGVVDQVTVSSHDSSVLARMKSKESRIGATLTRYFWDWRWWMLCVANRVQAVGADTISPKGSTVSQQMISYFRNRGIVVRAWGVCSDESLAARLIHMGIDGMTFDRPDRLWEILNTEREVTNAS